jgi:hypothetical protein
MKRAREDEDEINPEVNAQFPPADVPILKRHFPALTKKQVRGC